MVRLRTSVGPIFLPGNSLQDINTEIKSATTIKEIVRLEGKFLLTFAAHMLRKIKQ